MYVLLMLLILLLLLLLLFTSAIQNVMAKLTSRKRTLSAHFEQRTNDSQPDSFDNVEPVLAGFDRTELVMLNIARRSTHANQ